MQLSRQQCAVRGIQRLGSLPVSKPISPMLRQRRAEVSVPAAAANDDVKGDMLAPSAANNNLVRAATVAAAIAAVSGGTTLLSPQGAAFVHVLAYGTLLGSIIFNTFVVGLTMFGNMPRQMFGRVQSKMFPKYFSLTTGAALVLLAGHALSPSGLALASPGVPALLAAAALSVANWLAIEPYVTGLMFQRYDIENKAVKTAADEADIKTLYKKFGMWHGISSLNNLGVLAAVVAYAWPIAAKLVA